jgi:hypothetical protein
MRRPLLASLMAAMVCAGMALAFQGRSTLAVPEPSRVPISWELAFRHGNLERVFVTIKGKDEAFWFMRYTVTNNTGKDILFTPSFELGAETGTVLEAFKNVPNTVFEKIKTNFNNPLLISPNDIHGRLLQGEDNAKDGVVMFPALDPEARNFRLFVMGLSGETVDVENPITHKKVILQKSLELDFNVPGQAVGIEPKCTLTATKWVMK